MRLDLDEIERSLAARAGLDPEAMKHMVEGAVFEVPDHLVKFPATQEGKRTEHDYRRIVIVQAHHLLGPQPPETILVVPCSVSAKGCGRADSEVPPGERAFTKPNVVAYASLNIAVPKSALTKDLHKGTLSDVALSQLRAVIAKNFALGSPVALPPRT